MNNWKTYFKNTKNNPPSKSLVAAIQYAKRGSALDLGAGAFRDTRFLLKHFKSVVSVDKYSNADYKQDFKDFKFKKYDLINAQYSLPFLPRKDFLKIWKRLVKSLKPDGIFVGQFFGVEDEWNHLDTMSFFTLGEVRTLIKDFTVLKFKETKKQGTLANGKPKFWHVFHLTLKRPSIASASLY